MKKPYLLLLLLPICQAHAQINELGVFVGGSNYIGDIGSTQYIKPTDFSLGAVYKWNRSTRHAYRFTVKHAELNGNDADSDSQGRQERGLLFKNRITEVSAALEFNFLEFNLHELDKQFTPYVYTGLSYTLFKNSYFDGTDQVKDGNDSALAIPMAIGIKGNITPELVVGVEAGFRYVFSDNLDGSNPEAERFAPYRFGNINSNDWYTFTGITITYTFTEKPCFCSE